MAKEIGVKTVNDTLYNLGAVMARTLIKDIHNHQEEKKRKQINFEINLI